MRRVAQALALLRGGERLYGGTEAQRNDAASESGYEMGGNEIVT